MFKVSNKDTRTTSSAKAKATTRYVTVSNINIMIIIIKIKILTRMIVTKVNIVTNNIEDISMSVNIITLRMLKNVNAIDHIHCSKQSFRYSS